MTEINGHDPELLAPEAMLKPAAPGDLPWPNAPAAPGAVYGFTCPQTGGDMVAMLKGTFLHFSTQLEAFRRAADALDKKCKELAESQAATAKQFADLYERHEALRAHLRKDRMAALEQKVLVGGDTEKAVAAAVRNLTGKKR